jgi:VCBS repeat-containing protein
LIYGNGRNGITFLDAAGGPHYVINNTIRANGWNGVRVAREHSVTFLLNNLIVHNGVQPNTTGGRYGILREGSTKPDPAGLMLLNNLVCGNTVGEMNGPALDTTDLHNLTPKGTEGPGVQASPGCDQADSLFTHVLGDDGKSGTLDDDFTLGVTSPALDAGTDPRSPFQLRSRVRVVEGGLVGVGLYAETDTRIFSFYLNPNAVLINGQTWTTVSTQDNKVFHDYLLERHRSDRYNLIVDGTIRVQDGLPLPTGGNPDARLLLIGDPTVTGGNARAEYALFNFSQPRVISQHPPAGTLVLNKSDVDLTIQDGPATATVPNVVGLTRTAAETAIVAANLTAGTVTEVFSIVGPAGSVISQKPVADTHVVPQTAVDLVVSRGPPTGSPTAVNDTYQTNKNTPLSVPTPGVLGNDTDPEGNTLRAILVSSPAHGSLTLNSNGSFSYTPNTGFTGDDTFTYKANDGALDSNVATVTINVSGGSQTSLVPNVLGKTQADAAAMLVAANLRQGATANAYSDTAPAGLVIAQDSAPGTAVASQTAVDLTLSLGPNPQKVTVPDVVGQTQAAATTTLTNAQLGVGNVTTVDTTIALNFTTLPSTQNWLYGATGNTAPESQVFSVANGVLRQNTIGVTPNGFNRYQRATGVLAALPFALTITARVLQEEGDPTDAFGFGFGLAMGTEQFAFGLHTNGIHGPVGNTLSTAIDTTQFHEYRLEGASGAGFRLFVDGLLVGSSAAGVRSLAPVPFLFFGDLSDTANARGEISSYSFVQGAGLVIDQNPDAGVLVSQGSLVDVTLAKAAENVSVPNVVGQTKANAISTIK